MAPESEQEGAVAGVPQLDVIVPARAGDQHPVRGEGYVVDLLLVAKQTAHRFVAGRWCPEVNCTVVASCDEALDDRIVDCGGFFEAGKCFFQFGFSSDRGGRSMVVVGGAEDKVGGKGKVVDPMSVG